jgi:hypothetical protein
MKTKGGDRKGSLEGGCVEYEDDKHKLSVITPCNAKNKTKLSSSCPPERRRCSK